MLVRVGLLLGSAVPLGCTPTQSTAPATPPQSPQPTPSADATHSPDPKVDRPSLESLGRLETVADLKPHVADPRVEARRIVAQRLAAVGGTAAVQPLSSLADDRDPLVAMHALTALSLLGDGSYREVAAQTLSRKGDSEYEELVQICKEQLGAPDLLTLLLGLPENPRTRWYRQKAVFDALEQLHDPRALKGLLEFTEQKPHPHYEFRAAAELAQLGDPRAVPLLARRLRKSALELYSDQYDWELVLKRYDSERVSAARLIADLAVLHPDRVASFRSDSEGALLFYVKDMPSPHANGMRALAALGSQQVLSDLRAWAFPGSPLPKEGQQPPMPEEWIVAQSAQRYIGALRDPSSFQPLIANLKARPAHIDVTMEALWTGGTAILGMSLRAIGVGAAEGLSEWGDPRAFQPLLAYVRDPKNNEQSRQAACTTLAWLARDRETTRLLDEIVRLKSTTKPDEFRRQCLLDGLAYRTTHVDSLRLLPLLEPHQPHELRATAARVMGRAGLFTKLENEVRTRTSSDVSGPDAVVVLVLGGTPETAVEAVQRQIRDREAPRRIVATGVMHALDYLSREDIDQGFLFRVLGNIDALAAAGHDWVQSAAIRGLSRVEYDNGPHSLTRPVLRYRLRQMAQASDAAQRQQAIRALWYLRERRTLLALADSPNPDAELARTQAELLLKPDAACEACPENEY